MYTTTQIKNKKAIEISLVIVGKYDSTKPVDESYGVLLCHIELASGNTDFCAPMTLEQAKNLHENLGMMLQIVNEQTERGVLSDNYLGHESDGKRAAGGRDYSLSTRQATYGMMYALGDPEKAHSYKEKYLPKSGALS
jgi:hypothetical protein